MRDIKIMGILNVTPDSFFAASRYNYSILDSGADIIDIGACSTRPGHIPVGPEEEWRRLKPVLEFISREKPGLTISIDTYWSEVIRKAYDMIGDLTVNDVSAGDEDPQMLRTVGELKLSYIPMHHGPADSCDEIADFYREFEVKADKFGISDWIIDPGFGFGKTIEQNQAVFNSLETLTGKGRKVLVGISRKSMIYKPLGKKPEDVLEETCDLHLEALKQGADILRVHDVEEARKVVEVYSSMI